MTLKTIKGFVVVTKDGRPFTFAFDRTEGGAQVNFCRFAQATSGIKNDWEHFEQIGHDTVPATLTIGADMEAK